VASAGAQDGSDPGQGGANPGAASRNDDVVDAEFTEVKGDESK
jgi:hypothetical protein